METDSRFLDEMYITNAQCPHTVEKAPMTEW